MRATLNATDNWGCTPHISEHWKDVVKFRDPRLNIGFKARVFFPRPAAGEPLPAARAPGS